MKEKETLVPMYYATIKTDLEKAYPQVCKKLVFHPSPKLLGFSWFQNLSDNEFKNFDFILTKDND